MASYWALLFFKFLKKTSYDATHAQTNASLSLFKRFKQENFLHNMFPFLETHSTWLFRQLAQLFQVTLDSLLHFFQLTVKNDNRKKEEEKKTLLQYFNNASRNNWMSSKACRVTFLFFFVKPACECMHLSVFSFLFFVSKYFALICFPVLFVFSRVLCSNRLYLYQCVGLFCVSGSLSLPSLLPCCYSLHCWAG